MAPGAHPWNKRGATSSEALPGIKFCSKKFSFGLRNLGVLDLEWALIEVGLSAESIPSICALSERRIGSEPDAGAEVRAPEAAG